MGGTAKRLLSRAVAFCDNTSEAGMICGTTVNRAGKMEGNGGHGLPYFLSGLANGYIVPEYRRTPVMTDLMRCCFAYAVAMDCTDMLASVTPTHRAFYEVMAFNVIGSERNSSPGVNDPVTLVNES